MKSSRLRPFALTLIAALVFASTITRAKTRPVVEAPPDRGRFVMPFGFSPDTDERVLSFEDEEDEEEERESGGDSASIEFPIEGDKAWLLEPDTFNQLSSAGRRAALRLNGRLPKARGSRQTAQSGDFSAEAVPGVNTRVNNPALDTDFHTHSETSIAVNGATIIISFNEFDFNGYSLSTDSGTTWSHRRTPDPSGGFNLGDGVVAFGPGGECYYAGLAFVPSGSSTKSIVGVAKSTNGGASFSTPFDASTTASNTADFQDKEWIAVDKSNSSFRGNVYVSWTDFTQSNGSFISFSRSTNGGATFEAPIAVSPRDGGQQVQGSVPVVAPNGDVYVAYLDTHSTIGGIGIVKSTDGGRNFGAEKKVVGFTSASTMTGGGGVRSNSFPSVAFDSTGTLHMVYGAFTGSLLDRSDVFYLRSTDAGGTFSAPVKLNDDATATTQLFPSIAVATDGTIGVKWWDRRNDPMNDFLNDVYMTTSHDGGSSFGKNFRVSDHNWTFGPIEIGFAGGYHGDYDGIAADGSNFYLSWSDERNGEADAFFSQVLASRDPNTADFNLSAMKVFDNVVAGNSVGFDFSTSPVNGFSGPLALSASPAVSGITYNFVSPMVNAGNNATLNVSTSSAVVPGTYLITVTAAGGSLTRKSNFRLDVLNSARFAGSPVNASHTKGFTTLQAGVKVEASGTIHVVYDDDSARVRGSDAFYTRSTDGGATFSAPFKISGVTPIAFESTLALDANGNPYVAWTGVNPVPANGTFATFVTRSTDHGNSFSTPMLASSTSRNARNPKIAVDNSGRIVLTFIDTSVSGSPIFADRSTDNGLTFSTPVRVSQSGETIGNPPFVAVDSTGAAYVAYQDNGPPIAIKMAVAADGQNFAAPKTISDTQVSAFAPQIGVDRNDNLFVAFYNRFTLSDGSFNREATLIKSTNRGATFGAQVNLSNTTDQSTFPSLILGDQGRLAVAWEDTAQDPQRDVFVARSTDGGATFAPPINMSANSARSFGAFGGTDSSGNIFVGWTDDAGANTDVIVAPLNQAATGPPDFTLSVSPAVITAQRGTRAEITLQVNRFAGFTGGVTITPPDLAGLKAKKINFTPTATGGTLSFKLKSGGVTGPQVLTFTGTDGARTRSAIFVLALQPPT